MTVRVEAERAIADVLLAHERQDRLWIACRCGWKHQAGYPTGQRPHVAHLASVLADLMAERQAEAWDEGWRDCAQVEPDDVVIGDNPYRPDPKDTP